MLQATGGVNTHKGALYALSLLLAAMGRHLSGAQESVFSACRSRCRSAGSACRNAWLAGPAALRPPRRA